MTENQTDVRENQEQQVSLSELEDGVRLPHEKPRRNRRRRLLVASAALLTMAAIIGVAAYQLLRSERVDLKANRKFPEKVSSGNDIKQAAFDSISGSLTDPIAKPSPSADAVNIGSGRSATNAPDTAARGEKVSAPIQTGITATLEPPPDVLLTKRDDGRQQNNPPLSTTSPVNAPAASVVSPKPNSAQSIRYVPAIHSEATVKPDVKANNCKADDTNNQPARLTKRDAKPNFGAMLPVRLMGVLYTLRIGSLARLELVRDLKTQHWQLKRGTVFIGNVVSGDLDRAYLQIKGFIDPGSQAFVNLEGEVLGNDGGAGLRGRQKRISPAWVKVLDRAAQAGVQIATGILNRRSSSVIVATDPYGTYRSTAGPTESSDQNRSFVEVHAGTMGFVLVTTLPESSRSDSHLAGSGAGEGSLTDEELAELMTTADPARIRAALPKMNPELQRIARALLNEIESGKP